MHTVVGDPVFFVGLLVGDVVSSVGDFEWSRTTPVAVLRATGLFTLCVFSLKL